VAAIPNQLAREGRCFSNLIAIKADRAGADAIKTPTLLNSKLVMAIKKSRLATTSNVPERSAYRFHPLPVVLSLLFGEKIIETSNTPIRAPKRAAIICASSISVIKTEKPVKQKAAAVVKAKTLKVARWWVAELFEARNKPRMAKTEAMGKLQERSSSLTKTPNKIRLNDCTKATTGETKETEPIENAW